MLGTQPPSQSHSIPALSVLTLWLAGGARETLGTKLLGTYVSYCFLIILLLYVHFTGPLEVPCHTALCFWDFIVHTGSRNV